MFSVLCELILVLEVEVRGLTVVMKEVEGMEEIEGIGADGSSSI